MQCRICGGEDFRKDGSAKYAYGRKQRLRCKKCGGLAMGDWVSFDREAYDALKAVKFKEHLDSKKAYDQAKKETGWGGFRIGDL